MPSSEDRFNKGLVMLLDCVARFTQHLQDYRRLLDGKNVSLYTIAADKINQSSIKYSNDSME